jgi:hypothetical protein
MKNKKMKKTVNLLSMAFLLFTGMQLNAQIINFPDNNLEYALLNHNPVIDLNSDLQISVYEAQNFSGTLDLVFYGISDLTGIENFTNITGLNCASNNLASVNVNLSSFPQLKILDCGNNQITSLNLSALTQLETLNCYNNLLTQLDISSLTQLKELGCYNNQITNLNTASNINLEVLFCNFNQIQNLDISNNLLLEQIYCDNNQITTLDFSPLSNLTGVDCSYNQLTALNIANGNNSNMTGVRVDDNPSLVCIQIDSGFIPTPGNYWFKDDTAVWSEDCSALSIDNYYFLESTVRLFPNPARNIVNVEGKDLKTIVMYDMKGNLVLSTTNTSFVIDGLPSGIYSVKIENRDGAFVFKKLIVQ